MTRAPKKEKATTRDLVLAITNRDIAEVKRLYANGVSIHERDQYKWIPLHRAAVSNRAGIVRLLLKWGSPLEAEGNFRWTPLHLASISRSDRAIAVLLESGANIDARSESGCTPLHLVVGPVVTDRLLKSIRLLLRAGADPESADSKGETPLGKARATGEPKLIEIFEEHNKRLHKSTLEHRKSSAREKLAKTMRKKRGRRSHA
jgi:ankyrin repeat protein